MPARDLEERPGQVRGVKVLMIGTPRSGTSWSSRVVARAKDTTFVREPDGPASDLLGAMAGTRLGEYPCLGPDDNPAWYPIVWDLAYKGGWPWQHWEPAKVAGRRMVRIPPAVRDRIIVGLARGTTRMRRHPTHMIVKSVNSELALQWINRRYHFDRVVVIRRNLLNVVSSWMALEWPLIDPPLESYGSIRQRYLEPLGLPEPPPASDYMAKTAWQVGLLTTALKLEADAHPDWFVETHDIYCTDPKRYFGDLLNRLGLEWTDAVDQYLSDADQPGYNGVFPVRVTRDQPDAWRKRLSDDQADVVRGILAGFPLGDWAASAMVRVPATV